MWKRVTPGLLLLAALACGGDSSGPGDTSADSGPAQVIVAEGTASSSDIYRQSMTLHLRNEGGPGVYKLEVWGLPTSPNGAETSMGETEPVEVTASYDETLSYSLGSNTFVTHVLVFTRDNGSAQYRQTDRFDFQ
jgi:hypothetical protein